MSDLPSTMMGWTKVRDEPDGFDLIEHVVPVPLAGEVLVKTHSTSICGTDLHIWSWNEWGRSEVPLGTITGHETSGHIVTLGEGVSSHAVGDFVLSLIHI